MGAAVPKNNLVAYTLNGLSPKFQYIKTTICHKNHLPIFWDNRSMLLLKEATMAQDQSRQHLSTYSDHPSSQTILIIEVVVSHSSNRNNSNFQGGRGGDCQNQGTGGVDLGVVKLSSSRIPLFSRTSI